MVRLLGILTGSAIALAILIVTIGIPDFAPSPAAATPVVRDDPAVQLRPPPEEPEAPEEPVASDMTEMPAEPDPAETPQVPPELAQSAVQEPTDPAPHIAPTADVNWYAFWSPFRSEIAADGFVAELQRTTGLDYRVVRLKPGVYEVAFAYLDDNDIQEKLTKISTATGLDMSGG